MSNKEHPVSVLIEILRHEKYYLAKFIDWFVDRVPEPHQRALLGYIVEQVANDRWEKRVEDPYQWVDLVKSILIYYSGNDGVKKNPTRENLIALIDDYLNSKECLVANAEVKDGPKDKTAFADLMGEIRG